MQKQRDDATGGGESRRPEPGWRKTARAVDAVFQAALKTACILLFVLMIAMIGAQICMRYVFNDPLTWSEELARFAMIYLAFLAGALAIRHNQHIRVTGLFALPRRAAQAIAGLATLLTVAALTVLAWQGWLITGKTARQTSTALGVTMDHIYVAIPAAAALMVLGLLLSLLLDGLPSEDLEKRPAPTAEGAD